MTTTGKKVKYAEFIDSLSIFKSTIVTEFKMNSYWLEKNEMFTSNFDLSTPLAVSFSGPFTDEN